LELVCRGVVWCEGAGYRMVSQQTAACSVLILPFAEPCNTLELHMSAAGVANR
jgi:hypothetical protein